MKKINQDIKTGEYAPIYLLYGPERYLRNQYRDKLKDGIGAGDMNTTYYSGKGINVNEMIDIAETMPFLAERRLIVIEDADLYKEDADQLAEYIPQIPESTVIVYTTEKIDKRSGIFKAAKAKGYVSEFTSPDESMLTTWIASKMKQEGKQITQGAVDLIFERCGTDMVRLSSELDKLFGYTYGRDSVTALDVEAVCIKQTESKIFDMTDAVAFHDQKKALDIYYEMLTNREPAMLILNLLTRQFNQLLQVKELSTSGSRQISEKLHLNEYAVKKLLKQAKGFTMEALTEAVKECVESEYAVKTGRLDETLSVELILIKYSRRQ